MPELSKLVSAEWKALSTEDRGPYNTQAQVGLWGGLDRRTGDGKGVYAVSLHCISQIIPLFASLLSAGTEAGSQRSSRQQQDRQRGSAGGEEEASAYRKRWHRLAQEGQG